MNATLSETTASGKPGKKSCGRLVLLLSFCIPMLLLAVGFVLQQVHPFGDRQILVTDFWHQYYPFLRLLHEKLRSGGSLLYTWDSGMGTNFLSIFAYYAASPLNLLTVWKYGCKFCARVFVGQIVPQVGCRLQQLHGFWHRKIHTLAIFGHTKYRLSRLLQNILTAHRGTSGFFCGLRIGSSCSQSLIYSCTAAGTTFS